MRALLVTNIPSCYRRDLFDALGARRDVVWRVLFADPRAQRNQQRELPRRVPWSEIRGERFFGTMRALLSSGPDVVVVGGAGRQAAACALYCRITGRSLGVWWGGTPRSEASRPAWRHCVRRRLFANASFFFCYGPESAAYLRQIGVAAGQITVLGNATLDLEAFRVAADEARAIKPDLLARRGLESPVLLSVGSLEPRKNHVMLCDAFLRVRAALGHGSLLIVGDGQERARLERDHVAILPTVPWRRMPELFGLADMYVHPSTRDRWPQAVSEALAAGTPVVVSSQSGFSRFLEHGRDALVVDGANTDELEAAIARLATDEPLRDRLAAGGTQAVSVLGAANIARRMSDIVLAEGRKRV